MRSADGGALRRVRGRWIAALGVGEGRAVPHRWTAEGVTILGAFTGAHLLHLSIAGCVLNDLYREAAGARIDLRGVRVSAEGGFDAGT